LNPLLLIAIAGAAYWYFAEKKAITLLNYYVQGVAVDFDGLTPIMKINIGIQNPSNQNFTVRDFIGNLTANGQNIGTMSAFTPLEIPAASQAFYPVLIRMNAIGIVEDIISLIQSQTGISQTVVLDGYVNANGIVAPVHLSYKIAF
jgi:LEA14-like dessication related protein